MLLKCEWDSDLNPGLASQWKKLLNSLKEITFTVQFDTWIKSVQREFFKDKSNLKQFQIKLGVYLDTDNIYKCKGRLVNSSLPEYSKTPIFLPKESYFSNVIILKSHQNLKHNGIKDKINYVRSIYWIPKLKQLVRSIIRNCILCRRSESKPYPNPPSAQLVLYTCATTRAVHLDLVPDTSASSFMKSLKRFISRRGIPYLISDNATCFRNEEVKRLVQCTKRILRKSLFRATVTYEELLTLIVEIEEILNSRTITYVYNDAFSEPLTPTLCT